MSLDPLSTPLHLHLVGLLWCPAASDITGHCTTPHQRYLCRAAAGRHPRHHISMGHSSSTRSNTDRIGTIQQLQTLARVDSFWARHCARVLLLSSLCKAACGTCVFDMAQKSIETALNQLLFTRNLRANHILNNTLTALWAALGPWRDCSGLSMVHDERDRAVPRSIRP